MLEISRAISTLTITIQKGNKYKKAAKEEIDILFNPELDRSKLDRKSIEFLDEQKIEIIKEIDKQYVRDRDIELKLQRGVISNVQTQVVPKVPEIVHKLCRNHLKKQVENSPLKYEFLDDGERVKIKQRFDKEILEELPKLKFLNKIGIQPDYEDKDIEKPRIKPKVCLISNSPVRERLRIVDHSLDQIERDKLLNDKLILSVRNKYTKVPLFNKQLSREQVDKQRSGNRTKKAELSQLEKDFWVERINLFAQRAVERNKSIRDDLNRFMAKEENLSIKEPLVNFRKKIREFKAKNAPIKKQDFDQLIGQINFE